MKCTLVNLSAPPTAIHRPCLTPELLAATGARYSRNNEGLEEILSKIDFENTDKSVDGIFKFIDYGHASIADMAPVSIFIDGVSLLAAFWLWHICPTASGQESSTRYIRYNSNHMIDVKELKDEKRNFEMDYMKLYESQQDSYQCYEKATHIWEELAKKSPEVVNIPQDIKLNNEKQYNRMVRNYVFDRARVFLPLSAKTNLMLIQSARAWVDTISYLLSFPCKEFNTLGECLKDELNLAAPRLTKHAVSKNSTTQTIKNKIDKIYANYSKSGFDYEVVTSDHCGWCIVHDELDLDINTLSIRENRYSGFNEDFNMTPVSFGWRTASMGEIRDLNRHRTGSKRFTWVPNGFYCAGEEYPGGNKDIVHMANHEMKKNFEKSVMGLCAGNFEGLYHLNLGHTFGFEHTTTLDKLIYEIELRTGTGAHYVYARMMKELLPYLDTFIPNISNKIQVGKGEPE